VISNIRAHLFHKPGHFLMIWWCMKSAIRIGVLQNDWPGAKSTGTAVDLIHCEALQFQYELRSEDSVLRLPFVGIRQYRFRLYGAITAFQANFLFSVTVKPSHCC